jgi:Co/Zn/Cd efflux system component
LASNGRRDTDFDHWLDTFDAIASLAIVILIIPRAWSLLREVVDVLLEATPRGLILTKFATTSRGYVGRRRP